MRCQIIFEKILGKQNRRGHASGVFRATFLDFVDSLLPIRMFSWRINLDLRTERLKPHTEFLSNPPCLQWSASRISR